MEIENEDLRIKITKINEKLREYKRENIELKNETKIKKKFVFSM